MTTWPGSVTWVRTNCDAANDDPSIFRSDIYTALGALADVVNSYGDASGVCPLDADAKVPQANLPILPFVTGVLSWQTAGSFTWDVPAGVTRILVEVWGAGGGGGYGTTDHGGGGGAGGGAIKVFSVTPGQTITIEVGLGGSGGISPGSDGTDGADSSVIVGATTIFGRGGQHGFDTASFGGYGGTATGGDVNIEGGTAMTGQTAMGGVGGSNARSGPAPGAGTGWGFGGGGYGSGPGGPNPAIPGKDGGVLIQW